MKRVVVIGAGGSGKTTAGRVVARHIGSSLADLDALFWGPGWKHVADEEFVARVESVIAEPSWVISGNYSSWVGAIIWPKVDTLVWLDLPRTLTFWRVVRRTFLDALRHRELWPGCTQPIPHPPLRRRLAAAGKAPGAMASADCRTAPPAPTSYT